MSWDYPAKELVDIRQQASPLGNVPAGNQEQVLLEELLYALQGFDGDYIVATPLQSQVDERKFEIDESELLFN